MPDRDRLLLVHHPELFAAVERILAARLRAAGEGKGTVPR